VKRARGGHTCSEKSRGPAVSVRRRGTGGFSLLELVIVMSVTVLLTGLLLPALIQVRENAHRVICSSNLRQIGLSTVMYADDNNGGLPVSLYALPGQSKQELMLAHRGKHPWNWDGLGWLKVRMYCNASEIFYCPSHRGEHQYERYEHLWEHPDGHRIYTNYHYAGHLDWVTHEPRRLGRGDRIILATDGLRTMRDFNHKVGLNVLSSDNSVVWRDDVAGEVFRQLPAQEADQADAELRYSAIWKILTSNTTK
jgi:type II secretory pathway pseudopilin PulG